MHPIILTDACMPKLNLYHFCKEKKQKGGRKKKTPEVKLKALIFHSPAGIAHRAETMMQAASSLYRTIREVR
jgi:hypothetical protein